MTTKGIVKAYKLARSDGYDFYTGKTINYRGDGIYPHTVKCPQPNGQKGICSNGVIHASLKPNDCFVGAEIPCSAYTVRGKPMCGGADKWGFESLEVLAEITDLDNLFGWSYGEAANPFNPLLLSKVAPTRDDIELLKQWDSVGASVGVSVGVSVWDSVRDSVGVSVWDSVRASVWDSAWVSVWASVGDSVGDSVGASVGVSVWDSVRDSVWASVWANIGSIFPGIKEWKYIKHKSGQYPFQSAEDLWKRGLVPSFDGKLWRLHSGPKAEVVWDGKI